MSKDAKKRKEVKRVTFPTFSFEDEKELCFQFMGKIFTGKEMRQKKGETVMAPADLCEVINMDTGQIGQLIMNTVLKSTLEDNYPDASYVGCCFMIRRYQPDGKRYKLFDVVQVECS